MQIPHMTSLTQEEVTEKIDECIRRLAELKEKAPKIWGENLVALLVMARLRKIKVAVKGIMNIIHKESTRKQWRRIGNSICPQRGSAISQVIVPDNSGNTLYATRDVVETQESAAIAKRYKTA